MDPFIGNPSLHSVCLHIGIFCCNFCFTHFSFSIDCECLKDKAISYLTLVLPMPGVNNVQRMDTVVKGQDFCLCT